jgi:hypothetical protein
LASIPGIISMRFHGVDQSISIASAPIGWYGVTEPPVTSFTIVDSISSVMSIRSW